MKESTVKIWYIISVFLVIAMINNDTTYNILELRFLVPLIIAALGIGVIGVYLFGKDMKLYKNLHFISYVMTIVFTFVPGIGVYIAEGTRSYGFPAQWFNYYYEFGFGSIHLTGFVFNYLIFYLILRLLRKLVLRFSQGGTLNEA